MKVSREESLTQPFVLTRDSLESLHERLQDRVADIKLEINCKDSLKREFATFEELLSFENPPSKDIQSLRIMAHSENLDTRVWLRFDKDSSRNIFISIQGDEQAAVAINESLEENFSAIRPWYALLARTDFYLVLLGLWLVPSIFLMLAIALGLFKLHSDRPFSLESDLPGIMRGMLLGGLPLIIGLILNRVKRSVFPIGVFAIGQGAKRHKDKELFRTIVVVAFFVSLASSIVATLLFAFWR